MPVVMSEQPHNRGMCVKGGFAMNQFIKHLLCLGFLGLSGSAYAEGGCPNGMTPVNNGQNWTCVPGGNDAAVQQAAPQLPPQPTGYWVKTWGAIATSETNRALGTAVGANSEEEAKRQALFDCKEQKGDGCRVDLTYHNQCAVMVVGKKQLGLSRAASIAEATADGLKECTAKGDNCRVYYSACTEPRFVKY